MGLTQHRGSGCCWQKAPAEKLSARPAASPRLYRAGPEPAPRRPRVCTAPAPVGPPSAPLAAALRGLGRARSTGVRAEPRLCRGFYCRGLLDRRRALGEGPAQPARPASPRLNSSGHPGGRVRCVPRPRVGFPRGAAAPQGSRPRRLLLVFPEPGNSRRDGLFREVGVAGVSLLPTAASGRVAPEPKGGAGVRGGKFSFRKD